MTERSCNRSCEVGKLINFNMYIHFLVTFESFAGDFPCIPCYQVASRILRRCESKDSACIGSSIPSCTAIPTVCYCTSCTGYRWGKGLLCICTNRCIWNAINAKVRLGQYGDGLAGSRNTIKRNFGNTILVQYIVSCNNSQVIG